MKHAFLCNLTAALLALHTVLGCCWHHEHCYAQSCGSTPTALSPEDCHCDPVAHTGGFPEAADDGHRGPHECRDGTCTFLGPTKQSPHELPLQLHALAAAPARCGEPSVSDAAGWQSLFACDALLPSLRLHLIHCMLLI